MIEIIKVVGLRIGETIRVRGMIMMIIEMIIRKIVIREITMTGKIIEIIIVRKMVIGEIIMEIILEGIIEVIVVGKMVTIRGIFIVSQIIMISQIEKKVTI